jgi:hypothetical protein
MEESVEMCRRQFRQLPSPMTLSRRYRLNEFVLEGVNKQPLPAIGEGVVFSRNVY